MAYYDLTTKSCPFCAETIQSQAIKCRFCGEFLNTPKAKALQEDNEDESPDCASDEDKGVLFACSPSLWSMLSWFIKGFVGLVLAVLIMKFPIEIIINHRMGIEIPNGYIAVIGQYRLFIGLVIAALTIAALAVKAVILKMNYYEIRAERIEWNRGLFQRQVDNIDMFRVTDLKLRRNILDCILGVGTVVLITSDKTTPEFTFEKVHNSRELYDIIKKASLEADRRAGVIHVE
jgi:hypothetical protein